MGDTTAIEWTDHTFNPWWGCVKVSPGCRLCYANDQSKRYGHDVWGAKKPRRFLSDAYWQGPLKWNGDAAAGVPGVRGVERHLVFCASMADVFEDYRGPDAERVISERYRLFDLIEATPHLDWQLLTKRPENILRMAPLEWRRGWPPNIWIGTSVEDQRRADERIPHLADIPASVKFLSCEPLLGPVNLSGWWEPVYGVGVKRAWDWTIIGGESGGRARPIELEWVRSLVVQSRAATAAPFVKQLGAVWARRHRDEFTHPDLRSDIKGGNWHAWPEDLRVRKFPAIRGSLRGA
jgi:protein gp37